MEIVINSNYTLTSDPRQFIIRETLKGDQETLYYFASLKGVVTFLAHKKLKNSNVKQITELEKLIQTTANEIEKAFKHHIKIEEEK
jgi:ribosomal protein S13